MLSGPTRSLSGEYEYISVQDGAVDQDDPDLPEKWRLYQDGKGDPPLKDGEKPTVFKMQQLSRACFNSVRSLQRQGKQVEALEKAARGALTGVDGTVSGDEIRVNRRRDEEGVELADRDCIERIPWVVVDELGSVAIQRYVLEGK